jgi:hypothetical protein
VEERTEELEERIDAHADALPVRFGSPRLGDPSLSSAAHAGRLSPFGHPLMMLPAVLRQNKAPRCRRCLRDASAAWASTSVIVSPAEHRGRARGAYYLIVVVVLFVLTMFAPTNTLSVIV